jgi:hypothetical protein
MLSGPCGGPKSMAVETDGSARVQPVLELSDRCDDRPLASVWVSQSEEVPDSGGWGASGARDVEGASLGYRPARIRDDDNHRT